MWIFGYGSLIWKVGFDYEERREGYVKGWSRRFWQDSIDHRGVPEAPGRVATLVPADATRTWGAVYRIEDSRGDQVLERLDFRERGGYDRHLVPVFDPQGTVTSEALLYIATPGNPNWGGPLPVDQIATIVSRSHGPSGSNLEYLLELRRSLGVMRDVHDDHVEAIVAALPQGTKVW